MRKWEKRKDNKCFLTRIIQKYTAVHNYLGHQKGPPKRGRPKRPLLGGPFGDALFLGPR